MCGIAGFSLSPDEETNPTDLVAGLLLGIEPRGTDSTGVAYTSSNEVYINKANIRATRFIPDLTVPGDITTGILHTRFATQGSPNVEANNHPIDVHGLVGVHNGMIWNDDDLFNQIEEETGENVRIAQVDSEAIFASLLHRDEPITQTLERLMGSAAVAWIDVENDSNVLHLARVSASPVIYGFTEAGSLIFASTSTALNTGAKAGGLDIVGGPYVLPEGVYLRIQGGEVQAKQVFGTRTRDRAMTSVERTALGLA